MFSITGEPEIMAEPQDVIVKYGEDAMFTCMVAGEPEPEIVWLHDSAEISLQSQRYEVMGNGSLMVHGAEQADLGYFECVARNPVGRARSKPAKMMVVSNGGERVNDSDIWERYCANYCRWHGIYRYLK